MRNAALAKLCRILEALRPDLVLLPWRRDPHRDHRDSWLLAMDAIADSGLKPMTLEYAVWLEELGAPDDFPADEEAERIVFDITAVLAKKRAAIAAHVTQTTGLIADDPTGFQLTAETIARLTGPFETYWRPLP